jgi:hypothetical protein
MTTPVPSERTIFDLPPPVLSKRASGITLMRALRQTRALRRRHQDAAYARACEGALLNGPWIRRSGRREPLATKLARCISRARLRCLRGSSPCSSSDALHIFWGCSALAVPANPARSSRGAHPARTMQPAPKSRHRAVLAERLQVEFRARRIRRFGAARAFAWQFLRPS